MVHAFARKTESGRKYVGRIVSYRAACRARRRSNRSSIFGGALGQWLDYMPDGEVGTRRYWIDGIAYRVFNGHPEIETMKYPAPENGVEQWWPRGRHDEFGFRVKPGVAKVRFGDPGWRLGFARDAINSYALFRYMKKDGVIPQRVRFQVCIPLTYSAVRYFFPGRRCRKGHSRIYGGAARRGREDRRDRFPTTILRSSGISRSRIVWSTSRWAKAAADGGEEGSRAGLRAGARCLRLDAEGRASRSSHVLRHAVGLAVAAAANARRRRDPVERRGRGVRASGRVPAHSDARSRDDDVLRAAGRLKHDGSRVYMGAIHHLHGAGGLRAQLETMKKYLPQFGVGAPCGFGRTPDRPGQLITDDGSKPRSPIDVMLDDHRKAVGTLKEVMRG